LYDEKGRERKGERRGEEKRREDKPRGKGEERRDLFCVYAAGLPVLLYFLFLLCLSLYIVSHIKTNGLFQR
jgi:hypothetical protein